jgi:hypothetical protein
MTKQYIWTNFIQLPEEYSEELMDKLEKLGQQYHCIQTQGNPKHMTFECLGEENIQAFNNTINLNPSDYNGSRACKGYGYLSTGERQPNYIKDILQRMAS